ncbi:uncharacterized protein PV09_04315 [Verruconis gallopava]|uniref:tripeptidyl-peptidase II n=1 Tax=Verruconis gallopava TaxID=253628 RepID=A0A0D2AZQ0_9PEZI|nr:uncharacterized protein PV09_04315 [Verruconis gallopava]KIW04564.1 hypothetical protein PV09_04315 [Verruconis gallopava]
MAPSSFASLVSSVLLLSSAVLASPIEKLNRRQYSVKSFHNAPRKWHRHGAAPPDHVLEMQIGLKQSKIDDLLQHLNQVSDPKHERYGDHLSAVEVHDLVRPSDETVELVTSWLVENGISPDSLSFNRAGDWISVHVPVHQANRLLNTEYSIFEHEENGAWLVRTPEWSLPEYLHSHIDVIEPTNSFLRPLRKSPESKSRFEHYSSINHEDVSSSIAASTQPSGSGSGPTECNTTLVTPGCLRSLYGTLDYKPQATDKNRMSLANYLGELNIRSDLKLYLQQFRPEAVAAADEFKQVSINNGTLSQTLTAYDIENDIGVEGALDVQTMLGCAWPTPLITYSTGGSQPGFKPDNYTPTNTNEPYLDWVQYMLNLDDDEIPYVVSTSYADDEQTVSPDYAKRVCESFAQLGARGISLFFASGDDGVGPDGNCFSNDPPYARKFLPEFPSSCPYVTTVGATYKFDPEVAAYDGRFKTPFASGGGFSDLFPAPEYQKEAVSKYLKENNNFPQYAGLFNPAGRAYPDVAAQGVNYSVVYNSSVIPVDGTSASTPGFSSVIALVNDALLAAGRPTMGFLNPWLYGGGYAAFNDVTSGSSIGCNVSGFPAAEGWDAVTGFGTPNFPKILENLGIGKGGYGGHYK